MAGRYIPNRGDIVWLNFTPQSGHEQTGKRPALVLSPKQYNSKVGLAVFCPITSHKKGYPFEVDIQKTTKINGVVLSDQVKSLDWRTRKAKFVEKVPESVLNECTLKIKALLMII
ncbi:MAG: endoribonuclease MazF [Candidatus Marinimicrobia bacterium]|nr:endoribonuclease MazF [Candidatus Neomarinimicrobiota bacterium]